MILKKSIFKGLGVWMDPGGESLEEATSGRGHIPFGFVAHAQ